MVWKVVVSNIYSSTFKKSIFFSCSTIIKQLKQVNKIYIKSYNILLTSLVWQHETNSKVPEEKLMELHITEVM